MKKQVGDRFEDIAGFSQKADGLKQSLQFGYGRRNPNNSKKKKR